MRILHVNKFFYNLGGTERYMMELMRHQESIGHEVAVFAMEDPRNLPTPWRHYFAEPVATKSHEAIGAVQRVQSAVRFIYNKQAQRKMTEILDAFRPDVVHLHNYYHQLSSSILKVLQDRNIPTVQTLHDYHLVDPTYKFLCHGKIFEDTKGGKYWKIIPSKCIQDSYAASILETIEFSLTKRWGWDVRAVDRFICPTQFMQQKIVEYGVPAAKTTVVYHPVFNHAPSVILAETRVGSDVPDSGQARMTNNNGINILFAGRLSEEKGVEVLLSAMTRIDNPAIVLHIVGDGPMRRRLEQLALNLHLMNVKFHGHQSPADMDQWYRQCQFVVLPSQWYEVSPMVIAEAAGHSKPVIASLIGGLPELIENGKTGLLVTPNNVEQWAQRIQWLSEHPADRIRMGENAAAWASDRTIEKHLKEIEEVYAQARQATHTEKS